MKRVTVRCPICHTQKNELISDDLIELRRSIDRGIVLIGISEGVVCDHPFYIEIDKNYVIRNTLSYEDTMKFRKEDAPHYLSLQSY